MVASRSPSLVQCHFTISAAVDAPLHRTVGDFAHQPQTAFRVSWEAQAITRDGGPHELSRPTASANKPFVFSRFLPQPSITAGCPWLLPTHCAEVACTGVFARLQASTTAGSWGRGLLVGDEGERGDSNPRIAAPQAAALTTWRRPPRRLSILAGWTTTHRTCLAGQPHHALWQHRPEPALARFPC